MLAACRVAASGTIDERLVDALDRTFAAHAGPDGRMDADQLRAVLGLRTEPLARRIFAIVDANGDGTVSRDELVGAVRRLIAGSTRDKLAFAFRVHDEDGDGTIDEPELRRMLVLSLAEDDVSITAEACERTARTYFARADRDGDGRITFDEFEALAERYPDLLAQLTRNEARWIAPNEDLLARLEPHPPARARWLANRRPQLVVLALWLAACLAAFAGAYVGGRASATWLDRLGDACTTCIEISLGIVVLVVMRRLLTRVRATRLGRVLPIDDAVTFHRILGHALLLFAIGHGVARLVSFAHQTRRSFGAELLSLEGLTGLSALALLAVMWVFAREAVRRSRRFELFYFTHLLYLPFLAIAIIHAPAILAGGGVAIAGLLVEHGLRLRRRGRSVEVQSALALRSGVTRLELAPPPGFAPQPGDYVFLRIPAIARHEWHPFTLSSAPEACALTVHARSLGNWTAALRETVEQRTARGDAAPLVAYLDGPYGSPSRHLFQARYAVMIAAGIGVTPFASILESIALRDGAGDKLEHADFYWLNRDQTSFEWFAALLAGLETERHADRLTIHIHMTGGRAGVSAAGVEVARELLREHGHADLVTGLRAKTHMGHPHWEAELAAIQRARAPEPVHVFFCGPPGLGRTIRTLAARLGMPYREERF